ncbi:MAG: hypothetical protein EZS28_026185 [Streblomastix strix]|nr:MAG: hypothetical protein EZS28_026185 [Streblomastix strix]
MIERRMRFVLQKDLLEFQYVFYAIFQLNNAQHLDNDDAVLLLLFHYATFLKQICKQGQAGSDVIILCRILRPPIALRVILASEVVEQQRERMLKKKLKATVLLRILTGVEQRRLDKADDNLEEGVFDMRIFCQGLVRPQAELWELQILVEHIGDLTSKTQDIYIQLVETFRDESEGLICKERGQGIERELKKMMMTDQYEKRQYDVEFELQRERSNT